MRVWGMSITMGLGLYFLSVYTFYVHVLTPVIGMVPIVYLIMGLTKEGYPFRMRFVFLAMLIMILGRFVGLLYEYENARLFPGAWKYVMWIMEYWLICDVSTRLLSRWGADIDRAS